MSEQITGLTQIQVSRLEILRLVMKDTAAATTDATAASLTSTNAAITAIKNDFATLSAKYNALLAAVKAAGITA